MNSNYGKLWQIYKLVNESIRFGDTKAVAVLGIDGIIVGLIITNLSTIKGIILGNFWLLLLTIISTLSLLLSVYFALKCLNPTLKVGEPSSLIYFAHIAQKFESYEDYHQDVNKILADDNESTKEITNQVWVNSKVSWKKFKALAWSIRFLVLYIFLSFIGIIWILI